MRKTLHQAAQRAPGLPPVRGTRQAPLDIRARPSRELVDAFENHLFQAELAKYDDDHHSAAHHRREANIIWRELKLRLVPTDPNGNPRR